jgi:hypothetical protein
MKYGLLIVAKPLFLLRRDKSYGAVLPGFSAVTL